MEKPPTRSSDEVSPTTSTPPSDHEKQSEHLAAANNESSQVSPPALATTTPSTPTPPPDGGYGWVCTFCVFTINAHTWGINSSYGVFLAHYLSANVYPGATYLDYAFIGGLSIGVSMLASPLATMTTRAFGTRTTLLVGTALEFLSLITASFSVTIWELFLSQGVCFGLGMGFLFVGSVGIIPQWFSKRRSLANGIGAAGSGFGGLIYSLATQAMIKNIGLGWAFRVLAILALVVNTVCAILVRDRNKIIGSSQLAFDTTLFKRLEYLLLLAFGFFSILGYVVLLFSLANYANSIGLSASQASIVAALLNLGQGLGRPPIGYFSDWIGRLNMAFLMTFLAGLFSLVVWIFATSFGVLVFYALVGGSVAGTIWAVIAPVTAEIVGLKDVPSALNIIWLVLASPAISTEAIALEIVNFNGGRYLGAQIFVGVMYLTAAACMLMLRGWKIGEVRALAELKGEGEGAIDAVKMDADADDIALCRKAGRKRIFVDMIKIKKV